MNGGPIPLRKMKRPALPLAKRGAAAKWCAGCRASFCRRRFNRVTHYSGKRDIPFCCPPELGDNMRLARPGRALILI